MSEHGHPMQIVEVGDEAHSYQFRLKEENLNHIIQKIPDDMKVSVVSVVGAFRTGKSFLLTFMLRFLRHSLGEDDEETSEEWMKAEGDIMDEGNFNLTQARDAVETVEEFVLPELKPSLSFGWKGGHERQTTGIWMWSEPFFRTVANGEKAAILLVDTQGMFDNETSMGLTACIFGLSTLISSHQIYNVDKRVQEDNLQQLALFAEYGRMALTSHTTGGGGGGVGAAAPGAPPPPVALTPAARLKKGAAEKENGGASEKTPSKSTTEKDKAEDEVLIPEFDDEQKPFQRLEFLVRDWQNFEDEENYHLMKREMNDYIQGVIFDEKKVEDLAATREQILSCYENISCFTLPFPGRAVTKKTYNGAIDDIDELFRTLLNRYVRQTFGSMLDLKRINGQELTAPELANYVAAYVKLFQSGANFPTAKTMLEATSEANNRNAKARALQAYKKEMDLLAGPSRKKFVEVKALKSHHIATADATIALFKGLANMGRKSAIDATRKELEKDIESEFERYSTMNSQRNPFQNIEYYIVPIGLALLSYILRWVADASCSEWSTTCRHGSHALGHVYATIFMFMLIMSFGRITQLVSHMRTVMKLMMGGNGGAAEDTGNRQADKKYL